MATIIRCIVLLTSLAAPASAQVEEWHKLEVKGKGKGELHYAIVLPEGYDAQKAYPVLLALPPGTQDRAMVTSGLKRYWGAQAKTRGWIVISPAAPTGTTFHSGGEQLLGPLLVRIREKFRVSLGRMHLGGASNGGRSAFRVATLHPFEFQSVTVFPGHLPSRDDASRLHRLRRMRVRMFVGGDDGGWVDQSRNTLQHLKKIGIDADLRILDGEGHVPSSLDGDVVMEHLARLHDGAQRVGPEASVHATLDDFNDAAAKGDEDRYFGIFAPEGVFLGTDGEERWTLEQFRAFALPYFRSPSAWIYVPQSRHVQLSPAGDVAWFDEVVGNNHYGACRGTGALRKIDGRWRVTHYNLTIPVPNRLAGDLVARIRSFEDGRKPGTTTVWLVRHAEKQTGDDPSLTTEGRVRAETLTRVLRSVDLDAVFTSEFRRTQETVHPLCTSRDITPTEMPARDMIGLARRILDEHAGRTVLVSGHSNTLPEIMKGLGISDQVTITEKDYDGLYQVSVDPTGARLVRLHFGAANSR